MSDFTLQIDGTDVRASEGMTVLEAALQAGIEIPHLCYHEQLEPFGGCRLCLVEVQSRGRTKLVVSCVYLAEPDLVVRTHTEKIDRIRKTLLELLLAHAPDSDRLQDLAREYGADRNRFDRESSFCVHCGLCVRYCNEIRKLDVVGFVDRGIRKEVSFIPQLAARYCESCKECFPLCPTSYLQAAYVLTGSLTRRTDPEDG